MSQPRPASPAKLVIGFLVGEKSLARGIMDALGETFGALDLVSPWLRFEYTDYYAREMGAPLYRRMLAYKQLVPQDALPDVKHATNRLETRYALDGRRRVNIDPGVLLRERFVLATGKNFAHRIYLGRSIYADLTLVYRRGGFQTLPWTYPDYADARLQAFLMRARQKLAHDLKAIAGGPSEAPPD
ncbi:MAG: DUF4416 family protein [Desulfobacterales bacterium]|nr:DUF4416 family protein [Desulfobacterales bacterium]